MPFQRTDQAFLEDRYPPYFMAHAAIEAPPPQSAPTTTGWYTEYEEIKLEVSGLHRPNTVAFHVTLRIILARLPDRPGLKLLDIGGGAGSIIPRTSCLCDAVHDHTTSHWAPRTRFGNAF